MSDEKMHPVGDDPAWSESYYFNFVDPDSKVGMFTRMGFRPGNGWADALHAIYLEGKRVAFTYGRRDIGKDLTVYDGDLAAGHLRLTCEDAHKRWRLTYDGPAQDIPNGEILLMRSKQRPDGWYTPSHMTMDLVFDCLTEPHYAARGDKGHFEQSGQVTGNIKVGDSTYEVRGFGVRDKSWGPRDWGAGDREADKGSGESSGNSQADGPAPFVNWFSMNFGDHAAMGGSCFRHKDGVIRGEGWMQREGRSLALKNVVITSTYQPDSILHETVRLTATTEDGESIEIDGRVLSMCPTKIPMPGGATFVNEGLAEFRWNGRTGYGIAEHWHAVSL